MKLLKVNIFVLFVFLSVNLNSQNISGKIINEKDKSSIPFASIAIESSTLGTVTDFDGSFKFEIPEKYKSGKLIISCMGFVEKKIQISSVPDKNNLVFELKPTSVNIDEVVVVQKSLLPYSIIKKAIKSISDNFISKPYNYEFYYSNTDKMPSNKIKQREGVVLMYDNSGYINGSVYKTFRDINYQFLQSKRNFKVKYLNDGNTNLDDLLEFDIARHKGNILDADRVSEFEVNIKKETIYKGDSVWILTYKSKKPKFVSTGDFHAKSYSGEIYIKKNNYAVLYNKTNVKCTQHSNISRNLYSPGKNNPNLKEVSYFFEVFYKKQIGFYTLDKINYEIKYSYKNNKEKKILNTKSKLIVLKLETEKPQIVESRLYYENIKQDKAFWTNFKI